MIMIVMEMVTARPMNVNAQLIMSMHKIARIMDVSTYCVFIFIQYQFHLEFQNKTLSKLILISIRAFL